MRASRASRAYIAYLRNPEQHSNASPTHAGIGPTPEAAREAATYYNNQWPWVVVVARSRAPSWAVEEAEEAAERDRLYRLYPDAPDGAFEH